MDYYSAFPYYMGYQGYGQWSQPGMVPEDRILEDMEYLQQMYPAYSRRYQGIIKSVVDKMDYDGSFIYDQYPDKLTLQRMVSSVMSVIKANEEKENAKNGIQPMEDAIQIDMETGMPCSDTGNGVMIQNMDISDALTEQAPWSEKEPWIRELVTVLMCYEILMRRKHKQKKCWYL